MAEPTDVTVVGKEAYEAVKPLAYADEPNNWALLRYCDALVFKAQQAATYGRDNGSEPGWALLFNPHKSPAETLEWLSQFAGVTLASLKKALVAELSNYIKTPNFKHAAKEAAPPNWKSGSEETANAVFKTKEAGGVLGLEIETGALASGKASWAQATGPVTVAGVEGLFIVKEKENYSFYAKAKTIAETGKMEIYVELAWYNINGELLGTSKDNFQKGVEEHTFNRVFTAPAGTVAAQWRFKMKSVEAASKGTYRINELMLAPSPTNVALPYGDGDTPEWKWEEGEGTSGSNKLALQTEEQFIASQREYILALPASNRGTLKAFEEAARFYLTGNKTVFFKERDGGAYRLTVVTYTLETPNEAQVRAALEAQVPGGIILTYNVVPGAAYIIIRTAYPTYKKLWETEFLTYNGLRNNLPGT